MFIDILIINYYKIPFYEKLPLIFLDFFKSLDTNLLQGVTIGLITIFTALIIGFIIGLESKEKGKFISRVYAYEELLNLKKILPTLFIALILPLFIIENNFILSFIIFSYLLYLWFQICIHIFKFYKYARKNNNERFREEVLSIINTEKYDLNIDVWTSLWEHQLSFDIEKKILIKQVSVIRKLLSKNKFLEVASILRVFNDNFSSRSNSEDIFIDLLKIYIEKLGDNKYSSYWHYKNEIKNLLKLIFKESFNLNRYDIFETYNNFLVENEKVNKTFDFDCFAIEPSYIFDLFADSDVGWKRRVQVPREWNINNNFSKNKLTLNIFESFFNWFKSNRSSSKKDINNILTLFVPGTYNAWTGRLLNMHDIWSDEFMKNVIENYKPIFFLSSSVSHGGSFDRLLGKEENERLISKEIADKYILLQENTIKFILNIPVFSHFFFTDINIKKFLKELKTLKFKKDEYNFERDIWEDILKSIKKYKNKIKKPE